MEKENANTKQYDEKTEEILIKEGYQPTDELDTSSPPNDQENSDIN